jgi:dihydroxyacetone kinase
MTHLVNNPKDFPKELGEGFVRSNSRYVRQVFGGVVRATQSPKGKVSVICGGGTGHYPAFAGWCGPGLVDGVVTGNIFSSPSASQVYSVAKAAHHDGGIFIGIFNYAGDVLHFGLAAERLKAEGIKIATGVVTDDIASAPKERRDERRGIAGGLAVLKLASAAAEEGADLTEVARIFDKANEHVRTFGVAFSGCTLPGSEAPLFSVPEGMIGVGLGIHGEPGIYDTELGTADDLAKLLVDKLIEEAPDGAPRRVVALLNGLGSAKYEELFVMYNSVEKYVKEAGIELIEGQVGEFMTSLDMGGLSLSLVWLDDELERLWLAPCDTPSYHRHPPLHPPLAEDVVFTTEPEPLRVITPGSPASQAAARHIVRGLEAIADAMESNMEMLGELDGIAGDGDHGIGMSRGSRAAADAAAELWKDGAGVKTVLVGAGARWSENAGGASGALWGAGLGAAGNALGDDEEPDAHAQSLAVGELVDAIVRLGGGKAGQKTMLDAQLPFVKEFQSVVAATGDVVAAWKSAAAVAVTAATDTAQMEPTLGRGKVLSKRSIGHADPGATSFGIIATVVAEMFTDGS